MPRKTHPRDNTYRKAVSGHKHSHSKDFSYDKDEKPEVMEFKEKDMGFYPFQSALRRFEV